MSVAAGVQPAARPCQWPRRVRNIGRGETGDEWLAWPAPRWTCGADPADTGDGKGGRSQRFASSSTTARTARAAQR